ncbi:estradiol 17-beta-dehydrogenase 2 isoform X2 [Seriola aureovittata]|uniref:estradiol 17-beta-dehydrogenase 2 isoform X2 n=1 Tax=Seriola aureovittata TaxID=2871759 RepID=UPI0024BE5A82|nr:estradiol 17-beta-dehydrogenase 2 isoform X2 [Seriola aureovittata]
MEVCCCFSVGAAALYVLTLLWRFRRGRHAGCRRGALVGALGASLCFTVSPVLCGGVLLTCSLHLICVSRRNELLPAKSRAVLITGCDSGFGHALAEQLSEMGVQVFAGMLDVNGGGAQRLRERGSENLQVLQLDVTDSTQVETVHRYICTQVGHTGLWGLVNNAGILHCPADAELQPMVACRRCMEVNFLSAVNMCQVFLPLLRCSRGRIVNVSSMADIFGTDDDARRYRDEILAALSSEAREDYGEVYVSSLPSSLSRMSQQCAEDLSPVVDEMCHALLSVRPRPLYTPGQMGWLLPFLHRHCPTAVFDLIATTFLKHTECEPAGLRGGGHS